MNDPALQRDPIEALASEFTDRLRAGQHPSVQQYIDENPHVANEIRDLFPTIVAMEKLKTHRESRSGGRASLGPTRLQQLGDFRIVREIGRGGMGIVYEAEQLSLGRRVAVKVLPKQSLLDEKHLMRFRREAKTAARLHHTNIVPVLGVGEHDGFHFIVMQYICGVGLDEIIPHLAELGGTSQPHPKTGPDAGSHDRREVQISSVARAIFHGEFTAPAAPMDSSVANSAAIGFGGPMPESGSIGFELGPRSQPMHPSGHVPTRSFVTRDEPTSEAPRGDRDAADESQASLRGEATPGEPTSGEPTPGEPTPAAATRMNARYWRSVARIGAQVASALQYAHEHGTLHRDIKPANLLIDEQGLVWVADFGLAKAVEQDDVSRTGDVVGTLRYMAPEQLLGNAERRSDVYSLGLTLYELLTLRPAFDEADRKKCLMRRSLIPDPPLPRRIVPSVPRDLETIVLKAIAQEPERRYATAGQLAEDLRRFLEDRPILARRATALEHLWRWCRRNPAMAGLSGIAASLLILVAVVSTTGYVRTAAANLAANQALDGEKLQRQKAEATSELAWDALDRIFARFAPQSVVSPEPMTLQTAEGEELAVESPVVLSDQAAALLEELLTYYDKLAAQGDNDVAFQRRIADANRRVGAIQQRIGRNEQAEAAYRRAIEIYTGISSPADDPQIRVAIAALHNQLGTVFVQSLRRNDASDEFLMARRLLESLAARTDDPAVTYELAHTYYLQSSPFFGRGRRGRPSMAGAKGGPGGKSGLGSKSRSGRPDGAPRPDRDGSQADRAGDRPQTDDLSQAIALLEDLDQRHPGVPEYQQLLSMTYLERAKRSFGDPDGYKKAVGSAVSILASLVEQFPANPDFRFALATAYATEPAGERDPAPAERRDAITRLTASLSILKELQLEHPNVPEYSALRAQVSHRLGMHYLHLENFDQAIVHLEAGLKTQETLVRRHPTVNTYAMRLSMMRQTYADELRIQYELTHDGLLLEKAREQLALTLPRSMELIRSPEGDARMKGYLTYVVLNNYRAIADMCAELGDEEGAVAAQAAADEIRAELKVPRFPPRGGPRGGGGPRPGNASQE